MSTLNKNAFLDAVATKLVANQDLLATGQMVDKTGKSIGINLRDDIGMQVSFSNVLGIADNLFLARGGRDVVADYTESAATNFSGGEKFGDVSLVTTVGAIDVTILLLANSLIPYLAVDRSMNNPTDTIYYANLIAENTAAGVTANDTVMGNFVPPNANVNLGPAAMTVSHTVTSSDSGAFQITFSGEYLVPGSINIAILRTPTNYTAADVKKDGVIYCNGLAIVGVVNYTLGTVTISSGLATGDVITAVAVQDVGADTSGTNILKVRSAHTATQLNSLPKMFIFEENEAANMYMNKIMAVAARAGGITDYRALHFGRLTNMYIEDINRDLIRNLVTLGAGVTAVTLNLSTYTTGNSFALTKDDVISKFFIDLRSDLLSRTGVPATVCVTGTQGASLLQSVPGKWVAAPDFFTILNGFVGTFDGLPVYRHNLLDTLQSVGFADYFMACKLPDNSSGTMVFGEFLPLVQTPTVGNVSNPIQKATGWFSQVGLATIQSTLVSHGIVTLGTY